MKKYFIFLFLKKHHMLVYHKYMIYNKWSQPINWSIFLFIFYLENIWPIIHDVMTIRVIESLLVYVMKHAVHCENKFKTAAGKRAFVWLVRRDADTPTLRSGSTWTQISCKPVERKQVAIVTWVYVTNTFKQR